MAAMPPARHPRGRDEGEEPLRRFTALGHACSALLVTKKPDLTYEDENTRHSDG